MSTAQFKEFRDQDYSRLRLSLLRTKGGQPQREFLESVRETPSFLSYMRYLPVVGSQSAPIHQERLVESEYKDPPADTETRLFYSWLDLTPRIACRTTFWAHLTCEHIEAGVLDSSFLAANGGSGSGGLERIDRALTEQNESQAKSIDSCVRTVLRRLGGIPDRGNRSVYVNCPFARAWWRERIVEQVSNGDEKVANSVRDLIRISQTYWENFVDRLVSRNSTFGSLQVRNAFILSLAKQVAESGNAELRNSKVMLRACRMLSAKQGSLELSVLERRELEELISTIVESVQLHS